MVTEAVCTICNDDPLYLFCLCSAEGSKRVCMSDVAEVLHRHVLDEDMNDNNDTDEPEDEEAMDEANDDEERDGDVEMDTEDETAAPMESDIEEGVCAFAIELMLGEDA